jgi:hypothetical protein
MSHCLNMDCVICAGSHRIWTVTTGSAKSFTDRAIPCRVIVVMNKISLPCVTGCCVRRAQP